MEEEFGLDCSGILNVIAARRRCKIAVSGAIAEHFLGKHLEQLKQAGDIVDFLERDKDGEPDFWVKLQDREFDLECKRATGGAIDLMRTRAPKGWEAGRYYHPDEFQMIAACQFKQGKPHFAFALTSQLKKHPNFGDRLDNAVSIPDPPVLPWSPSMQELFPRTLARDQEKLDRLKALKRKKRAAARNPRKKGP